MSLKLNITRQQAERVMSRTVKTTEDHFHIDPNYTLRQQEIDSIKYYSTDYQSIVSLCYMIGNYLCSSQHI